MSTNLIDLTPVIISPINSTSRSIFDDCSCGSAHGAGSGGGCDCGSESGGGA